MFFTETQNKLLYAITDKTAAEIITNAQFKLFIPFLLSFPMEAKFLAIVITINSME